MARKNAKKQPEAPQVDVGAEIFAALEELEKIKGIPVDYMVERLKQALANAYRKDREDRRDVPADNVVVDLSKSGLSMHIVKTVVEELEDTALEIHIDTAKNLDPNVQVGDTISIPVNIAKFGRIAAQTAKQVVIQGIREAERGVMYESYSSKAQELLTGTVLRIDPISGDMFVRVGSGNETSDAVLRTSEQIPGESYREGDMIRVYVLEVHKANRGPLVHVSRTHPNLVRRLFELETPEIAEGQVEVRNIAREAGSRSKMAVRAVMEGVDPVGACVGPRGGRVGMDSHLGAGTGFTGDVAHFHLTVRDFRGFQLEQTADQVGVGPGDVDQGAAVCLVNLQDVDPDQVAFGVLLSGDLLGGTEHSVGSLVALADADEHVAAGGIDPQHGAQQQLLGLAGVAFVHNAPLCFPDTLDNHLFGGLGSDAAELLNVHGDGHGVAYVQAGVVAAGSVQGDLEGHVVHDLHHGLDLVHAEALFTEGHHHVFRGDVPVIFPVLAVCVGQRLL